MTILHGSWLLQNQGSCLFVWGETWRSFDVNLSLSARSIPQHPFAIDALELVEWLNSHHMTIAKFIQPQVALSKTGKNKK